MGYAVLLLLREGKSQAIRQLFATTGSVLERIGVSPHVSLAVFEDVNVAKLTAIVKAFAASTSPLTIHFSSVGLFPGSQNVVFLAPVVTSSLLSIHKALHLQLAAEGLSCDPYYRPDAWVPHCAITVDEPLANSLETISQIHKRNLMGGYEIDQVDIVKFRPVVTLATFKLGE
jgi:2'-5' RNA ligase